MKSPLPLLLALSLGLNAALALYQVNRAPENVPVSTSPTDSKSAKKTVAAKKSASSPAAPEPIQWHAPKSDQDLQLLVADLRAAGFPPSALRAVVSQVLRDRLMENDPNANLPYWKTNAMTPELAASYQKQMDDYRKQSEALLGRDALPSATLSQTEREQRFGNLSDEKIDALAKIERDYAQMSMTAMAARGGNLSATDYAAYKKERDALNAAKMADLAAVMTPEELTQYEMRTSDSSRKLMRTVQAIDLNESEYAALYQAQKKYDAAVPVPSDGNYTSELMAQRNAAQQALNEQARAVLSDDRFYQYLKLADSNYGRVAKFAANYPEVTPATSYALYQLQTEASNALRQSSQSTRNQPGVSPEQRMLDMQTLAAGYETKLLTLVGPQVAEAYKKDPAGSIFSSLSRLAKPRTLPSAK